MGDDTAGTTPPAPPGRGWYPDPDKPGYQRFWNGQRWQSERYWGAVGGSDDPAPVSPVAGGSPGMPPPRRAPFPTAPVAPNRWVGPPLNPRGGFRQVAGAAVALVVFFVVLVRIGGHGFPPFLLVFFGIGLLLTAVRLPAHLRFLRDPTRRAAVAEPIMFEARVWLRFTYAPNRWPYPLVSRWDLGVRTDSFQITNWIYGQRNRSRSTFFHSADMVMWRASVEGMDCIVVSGPNYLRSRVEFSFSAYGQNPEAWQALQASGVRVVDAPPSPAAPAGAAVPAGAAPPPPTPVTASAAAPPAARPASFRRLGHDLGSARADSTATPQGTAAPGAPAPSTWQGRGKGKSPIRARRTTPAVIVVLVVLVFVSPIVLALTIRLVTGGAPDLSVRTTECARDSAGDHIVWSGVVTANQTIAAVDTGSVFVTARLSSGLVLGLGSERLTSGLTRGIPVAVGPIDVAASSAQGAPACTATYGFPGGR